VGKIKERRIEAVIIGMMLKLIGGFLTNKFKRIQIEIRELLSR
jgi:hypothetical protein